MTTARADQMAESLEQLETALDSFNSEDVARYLDSARMFWRYSATNIMLLTMQASERGIDPTMVAGFREWEREGRHPRKGSRSLMILAPMASRSYVVAHPGQTATTVVSRKADVPAGARIVDEVSGRPRFKAAHVFDVSQTDGEPIDTDRTPPPPEPEAAAALHQILVEQLNAAGFTVRISDTQRGLSGGYTDFREMEVVLPSWVPDTHRTAVLAHEYAHAMLHGPDDPLGAQYNHSTESRGLAEVEAEATAYLILSAHGINSTSRSANYLAGWSDAVIDATPTMRAGGQTTKRSDVVRGVLGRITSTAKTALVASNPAQGGGKPPQRFAGLDQAAAQETLMKAAMTGPETAAAGPTISAVTR
jgi:antirestriction protein ArdC